MLASFQSIALADSNISACFCQITGRFWWGGCTNRHVLVGDYTVLVRLIKWRRWGSWGPNQIVVIRSVCPRSRSSCAHVLRETTQATHAPNSLPRLLAYWLTSLLMDSSSYSCKTFTFSRKYPDSYCYSFFCSSYIVRNLFMELSSNIKIYMFSGAELMMKKNKSMKKSRYGQRAKCHYKLTFWANITDDEFLGQLGLNIIYPEISLFGKEEKRVI